MSKASKWERITEEDRQSQIIPRPSRTYWQDAWRMLRKNVLAMIGLFTIMNIFVYKFLKEIVMLAKYWKKIGLFILIVACVFNVMTKLINKLSLFPLKLLAPVKSHIASRIFVFP